MNGRFNMLDEKRAALIIRNLVPVMLQYILSFNTAQTFDVRHVLILPSENTTSDHAIGELTQRDPYGLGTTIFELWGSSVNTKVCAASSSSSMCLRKWKLIL